MCIIFTGTMADNRRPRRRGRPPTRRVVPRAHPYQPIAPALPGDAPPAPVEPPGLIPTQNFFATFSQFDGTREDVVQALEHFNCTRYVVAREVHHDGDGNETGHHVHTYFKTGTPFLVAHLRTQLVDLLRQYFRNPNNPAINIQVIKEAEVAAKVSYATKEDLCAVIVGVPLSYASLYYRQHVYIKTHRAFEYNHPLVFECRREMQYLVKRHAEYWQRTDFEKLEVRQREAYERFEATKNVTQGTWVHTLRLWTEAASTVLEGDPFTDGHGQVLSYKPRNLYLWGESGVGKTTTLELLIPQLTNRCFTPTTSEATFAYSGLTSSTRAIYIPDADPTFFSDHRETVLRLAEGKVLSIASKFTGPSKMAFYGVFVVVSNFQPPTDAAFANRFTIIHAPCPWSDCVTEK